MEERKYNHSHPWIRFGADLSKLNYSTWILLGAAQSKCQHLSGIPLSPSVQSGLAVVSLTKGVHATTAIEGNTLSEDEVKKIIEGNSDLPKSKEYQKKEVENILAVYNRILNQLKESSLPGHIHCDDIRDYNRIVLNGLELADATPGEIRTHSVHVQRYLGAPAEDCDYLLDKLCLWLNEDWGFDEENKLIEAILKAILGHLYIAWIHPFGDGNGRTARALELRILLAAGVPMNAAHLLSDHYNSTRTEYYTSLDLTSRDQQGSPEHFITYAAQGLVDALDKQITIILKEQLKVTWSNYVYRVFGGTLTTASARQRSLILEISRNNRPLDPTEIRRRLSSKLLEQYDDLTQKAFRRDLNTLVKKDLLRKDGSRFIANKDVMKAFMPLAKKIDKDGKPLSNSKEIVF